MVKIGEFVKVKDVECLVLDIINENPFVIALDTKIESCFNDKNSNYSNSILEKTVNDWFEKLDVSAITRTIDLTTMDGSKCYGTLKTKVAPLTFDEWRKYAEIIIPNIKNWFWLVTVWADPKWDNWCKNTVCVVGTGGTAYLSPYGTSNGLAPAFILDKAYFIQQEEKND